MDHHHRKHKKHKKEKKKKARYSSSESEDEWIEKKTDHKNDIPSSSGNGEERTEIIDHKDINTYSKRDDWMSMETNFACFSHKKENKKEQARKEPLIEKAGQSSRELNPYWRDGGTGLPPEKEKSLERSRKNRDSKTTEDRRDQDEWRKPDTKTEYESKRSDRSTYSDSKRLEKYDKKQNDNRFINVPRHQDRYDKEKNLKLKRTDELLSETDRRKDHHKKTFKKPQYDDYECSNLGRIKEYDKHLEDSKMKATHSSNNSKRGWKKDSDPQCSSVQQKEKSDETEHHYEDTKELSTSYEINVVKHDAQKVLSRDELNMLCAKILKAELKGNMQLAEKLQKQLDNAKSSSNNITRSQEYKKDKEIIILTETDSKGFTRPLKSIREDRLNSKRKVETHEGNKRMRYFADDDSQSLSEMFEKERFSSSREQNATFMKLMGKEMSENNEDAFEETASMKSTGRHDRKEWDVAAREHVQREKALDNCYWCLDSKNMNQDVIVAMRNQVYLCVPSAQSLTEGHCVIVPHDHISCATNLDEDVWEDIMSLRKNLVKMFEAEGDDIIFFECASNLDKFPHMQLHCVPVPKETGDVAPIYFKKAIMECEMEWSTNKKVIDLSGKNVRKAVPKGLPYFAVDFGMQPGYAHVIEDKKLFPNNFAQAIIGGMLDIDHSKWRKLHKDDPEIIRKKADYLKQFIQKNL